MHTPTVTSDRISAPTACSSRAIAKSILSRQARTSSITSSYTLRQKYSPLTAWLIFQSFRQEYLPSMSPIPARIMSRSL